MIERGHDVKILTSEKCESQKSVLSKSDSKFARKLFFDYYYPGNVGVFKNVINDFDPDLVHFHNIYGIGSSLLRASMEIRPTVTTAHDYWPFCYRSTMITKGNPCSMRCRNCRFPLASISRSIRKRHIDGMTLIAPSKFMEKSLKNAGFNNVVHIYNGIHLPLKPADHTEPRRILFAGRLVKEKGLTVLLDAVENLDVQLHIFGNGPLKSEIENRAMNNPNIKVCGFVEDGPDYWKGGVVTLPSVWPDNLPTTLLEAMSYGLPMIASDIGGIPEIVHEGVNGHLVPPGDVNELRIAIDSLLDSEKYFKFAAGSKDILSTTYTWDICAQKHEKLYQNEIQRFNHSHG